MLGIPSEASAGRSARARDLEAVADAAHGGDERRPRGVRLDLRAQALHVDVERLRVADVVEAPDAVDQAVARHHPARVEEEVLEQLELLEGEAHLLAPYGALVAVEVEADAGDLEHVAGRGRSRRRALARRGRGQLA